MSFFAPPPKFRAVNSDGLALVGGKVYSYLAGTSTPRDTYVAVGGSANTNPVILDARGECDLVLDGNYKLTLTDENDALIWTVDNIRDLTSNGSFANATFTGTLTITSAAVTWSGNPVTHAGNHAFTNTVTVNGGLAINATTASIPNDLTFTDGELSFTPPNGSFTPSLTFGGAAVGMTFVDRSGSYIRVGDWIFYTLGIRLLAKGSSTGTAIVTGLPFAPAANASYANFVAVNMAAITGALVALPNTAATTIALSNISTLATGAQTVLNEANFTNSSTFGISGCYRV